MRINIFICHTPFHNFICNNLCQEKFFEKDFKNFIISSVDNKRLADNVSHVLIKEGLIGRLVSLQRAKTIVNLQVRKFKKDVEFFLPHIDGVLGNYIFHSQSIRHAGANVNFFYDGILMLDANRSVRVFPRLLKTKRLLSMSIFHHFVFHKDILPVSAARTNRIYTPLPMHTPGPLEKMVPIRFPAMKFQENNGLVVILGSDVGANLEFSYEKIISFCLTTIKARRVLFKPHHADRMHLFQSVASRQNVAFDVVKGKACIEELISGLEPEFIIAPYMSSALINIKVIVGSGVRVICMGESIGVAASGNEIMQLAESLGVEIVTFTKN